MDKLVSYQTGQHLVDRFINLRPVLVWYWFNLIFGCTHESVDIKHAVQIINEGGSIIISHYIIHGGYCKDINHCCRKWLNNCHKSPLNTIHNTGPPQPFFSDQYVWKLCYEIMVGFFFLRYSLFQTYQNNKLEIHQLIHGGLQSFINTQHPCKKHPQLSTFDKASSFHWYSNGWFSRMTCSWYILHIPACPRWVLFEDKRPVSLWKMVQWIKRNMCGQEYQELFWVSLLSTSQGTPQIIVHQLLFLNSKYLWFFFPLLCWPSQCSSEVMFSELCLTQRVT